MRKNCMAEVAKTLGVELEEPFRIDGKEGYFRLTDTGLGVKSKLEGEEWFRTCDIMLVNLLTAVYEIIKLPWKPQIREKYYVPRIATRPDDRYYYYYWNNNGSDIRRYDMGIVCKTKEEAVAMTKKMLAVVQEQAVE